MIEIDGSYGEGGGAVLRQALGLAAYAGTPLRVRRIRAGREQPGLRPQHLRALEAVGALCGARVQGAAMGSQEVTFVPGQIKPGRYQFDIGTAGSTTLLLQTVLVPCLLSPGTFEFAITGGTDVPFSPQADYLGNVTAPALKPVGDVLISVARRGYYPKGGGQLGAWIRSSGEPGGPLNVLEQGGIRKIHGHSHASAELASRGVADRQADAAEHQLERLGYPIAISIEYSDSLSPGSGITLWTESTAGSVLAGSALGASGKPSEEVGREAARELMRELDSSAAADRHLADQLVPFLAVLGGALRTSEITEHTRSAIYVARQIMGTQLTAESGFVTAVAAKGR